MTFVLTQVEARVLGSLLEKETTTPEYYPLSLNALLNACNQKSNRDPVMDLDEDTLRTALHTLADKGLSRAASASDHRVPKYEHQLEAFNFGRREAALLCVLLLRGPQTPGELRGRAERLFRFDELSDVQSALQRLMQREPALVKVLPRQPGNKEARYAHLLCGDVLIDPAAASPVSGSTQQDRLQLLEEKFAALESELAGLKQQLSDAVAHFT